MSFEVLGPTLKKKDKIDQPITWTPNSVITFQLPVEVGSHGPMPVTLPEELQSCEGPGVLILQRVGMPPEVARH